jgi:hypothetical protein
VDEPVDCEPVEPVEPWPVEEPLPVDPVDA